MTGTDRGAYVSWLICNNCGQPLGAHDLSEGWAACPPPRCMQTLSCIDDLHSQGCPAFTPTDNPGSHTHG